MLQARLQPIEDMARTLIVLQGLRDNILKLSEQTKDHFIKVNGDIQEQGERVVMLMEHAAGVGREINRLTTENAKLTASIHSLEEKLEEKEAQIVGLTRAVEQLNLRIPQ